MRESASTDLREPQGSNPLGPPGPEPCCIGRVNPDSVVPELTEIRHRRFSGSKRQTRLGSNRCLFRWETGCMRGSPIMQILASS